MEDTPAAGGVGDAAGVVSFTPGIDLDYVLYSAGLEVRFEPYQPFQEDVSEGLTSG